MFVVGFLKPVGNRQAGFACLEIAAVLHVPNDFLECICRGLHLDLDIGQFSYVLLSLLHKTHGQVPCFNRLGILQEFLHPIQYILDPVEFVSV